MILLGDVQSRQRISLGGLIGLWLSPLPRVFHNNGSKVRERRL